MSGRSWRIWRAFHDGAERRSRFHRVRSGRVGWLLECADIASLAPAIGVAGRSQPATQTPTRPSRLVGCCDVPDADHARRRLSQKILNRSDLYQLRHELPILDTL